jgi:hypothetical protein
MNDTLTKKLLDDFPMLYRNRRQTLMKNGFVCGDGWFNLIYELSHSIENAAREDGLKPESANWPLCQEVKEKLGSLRFVVFASAEHQFMNERISELRSTALEKSLHTCSCCGQRIKVSRPNQKK